MSVASLRFNNSREISEFAKGKFRWVSLDGITIGRARSQLGSKLSEVDESAMYTACYLVEPIGMVFSGSATNPMVNIDIVEMKRSDLFYLPPLLAKAGLLVVCRIFQATF